VVGEDWLRCCGPLEEVKAMVEPKVASASRVSSSKKRSFRASQKDENELVRCRIVFRLSNFLFNRRRRFRTRVQSSMCMPMS
jgi:hypothetical protein